MKRLPQSRWFFVAGLLTVIAAGLFPIQISIWTNQHSFELGSGISGYPDSVDIPLNIFPGDAVDVTIRFGDSAIVNCCEVYVLVNYQYPTKYVGEAALRFSNQSEISCTVSWGDVRLIPVFVTGFVLRIFYSGSNMVQVETTITKNANVLAYGGVGIMIFSIALVLVPRVRSKLQTKTQS